MNEKMDGWMDGWMIVTEWLLSLFLFSLLLLLLFLVIWMNSFVWFDIKKDYVDYEMKMTLIVLAIIARIMIFGLHHVLMRGYSENDFQRKRKNLLK